MSTGHDRSASDFLINTINIQFLLSLLLIVSGQELWLSRPSFVLCFIKKRRVFSFKCEEGGKICEIKTGASVHRASFSKCEKKMCLVTNIFLWHLLKNICGGRRPSSRRAKHLSTAAITLPSGAADVVWSQFPLR